MPAGQRVWVKVIRVMSQTEIPLGATILTHRRAGGRAGRHGRKQGLADQRGESREPI